MRVSPFLCCSRFLKMSNRTGQFPYQKTVGSVNCGEHVGGKTLICLKLGNVILSATYNLVSWVCMATKGADPVHCYRACRLPPLWLSGCWPDPRLIQLVLPPPWQQCQPEVGGRARSRVTRRLTPKPPSVPAPLLRARLSSPRGFEGRMRLKCVCWDGREIVCQR